MPSAVSNPEAEGTPPSVRNLLAGISRRLDQAGIATPGVDAELLVRSVTGWSRSQLLLHGDGVLPSAQASVLDAAVARRETREPLQLIVGSVGFRYLDIEVRSGVFIPRPETEVLAGEAIRRVRDGGIVVEPCTGTGAIACSVATESGAATVFATDLSRAAVDLARANATRTGAAVTVFHGDLLDPVPREVRGRVDVLVSNPPYLTPGELDSVEPEVSRWDPVTALVSGPSGHEVTDRLIAAAGEWLRPGGWLLVEVDAARAGETAGRARAAGLSEVEVPLDLTGAERIIAARRGGS